MQVALLPAPLPPAIPLTIVMIFAVVCALVLCRHANRLAQSLKLMDIPCSRKRHARPTPLLGGLALLIVVMPIWAIWTALYAPTEWHRLIQLWIAGTLGMTILGLVDDRRGLSPMIRLVISSTIIAVLALCEPRFNIRFLEFENPTWAFGFGYLPVSVLFTTFCLVGFTNAVNMADGKNGLILGLSILWTALLGIRAPAPFWPLCAVLAVVLVTLLAFNLRGRLFLGDGGSYGLAMALGLFAILIYNLPGSHANRLISAEELILVFFVPVADFFRVLICRLLRGKSPMEGGRDHLHHHLQDRFGWPNGLLVYYGLALIPVCLVWALD